MLYRFGAFELDEEAGELRRDGKRVPVQPKPLALLALLVRERARVVPADELLATLWPDAAVTPGSLSRAVSAARRALGDTRRATLIRSVARRGYRFCGDVLEIDRARGGAARAGAPVAAASDGRRPADAARVFVGRDDALGRLGEAWAEASAGRGSLVLVSGPPGIGKTRLVDHFAEQAAARGARVLPGRCREGEGVPAFWLWTQVLRRLLEADGGAEDEGGTLRELAGQAPGLADLLPELAAPGTGGPAAGAGSPERDRFLLFDATTRALARASRRRPLLLVLEDLHWAGPASLRLLEHLAFESEDDPILVVATVRDALRERGDPLARTLGMLRQQARTTEIALGGFSRREVASLLEQVLGSPAPADLTSELFAFTEGVPLFLRETLRLLAERGALARPERIPLEGIALPGRSLDLIRRALDALPEPVAALVEAASVLGREFALPVAASVAGVSREQALDLLDEAARAGVLEAAPEAPASYRFVHALFREAAYDGLAPGERARLHGRAAEHLERQHAGDADRAIAELAHHHHRALAVGDPALAFERALRAAELAQALFAWEQAAVHYEQAAEALEHCAPVDPARRLEVGLALGEAWGRAGDRRRRRAVLAEALARARALGRPRELARAAIGFCDVADWGVRDEAAREAIEEALRGLDGAQDGAEVARARLITRLAYLLIRSAHEQAQRVGREAVALARAAGDPEALQDALYVLHFALGGPEGIEERGKLWDEVREAAAASRSADRALIACLDVASDRLSLGDAEGARRMREAAERLSGERPHPGMRWHVRVYDTGLALLEGRLDEVPGRVRDAYLLGQRVDHPYAAGCRNGHEALLALDRGEPERLLAIFEPTLGGRQGPTHWVQAVTARARLAAGREREARELFASLAACDFDDVPRNLRWVATLVEIALLAAELGAEEAHVRKLRDLLAPVEHHHAVLALAVNYGGPVTRALGRLAERLGRGDDAASLYEDALDACQALGARPMAARTALDWGTLLARRRERRRAGELLDEARRTAEALGMPAVARAAGTAFERLG